MWPKCVGVPSKPSQLVLRKRYLIHVKVTSCHGLVFLDSVYHRIMTLHIRSRWLWISEVYDTFIAVCQERDFLLHILSISVSGCLPVNVTNGHYIPNNEVFNFNDIISYSCDIGYNRTTGDETRNCQNDGSWSGTLLTCSSMFNK